MMPGGLAHDGSVILCSFIQVMILRDLAHAEGSRVSDVCEACQHNGESDEGCMLHGISF